MRPSGPTSNEMGECDDALWLTPRSPSRLPAFAPHGGVRLRTPRQRAATTYRRSTA